jgi:hypothetical protein
MTGVFCLALRQTRVHQPQGCLTSALLLGVYTRSATLVSATVVRLPLVMACFASDVVGTGHVLYVACLV